VVQGRDGRAAARRRGAGASQDSNRVKRRRRDPLQRRVICGRSATYAGTSRTARSRRPMRHSPTAVREGSAWLSSRPREARAPTPSSSAVRLLCPERRNRAVVHLVQRAEREVHRVGVPGRRRLGEQPRHVSVTRAARSRAAARSGRATSRPNPTRCRPGARDRPCSVAHSDRGSDVPLRRLRAGKNVRPISGRAGAAPALEPREAYPPARSTASAGYVAGRVAGFERWSKRCSAENLDSPCS
jgi:hypothetical protein